MMKRTVKCFVSWTALLLVLFDPVLAVAAGASHPTQVIPTAQENLQNRISVAKSAARGGDLIGAEAALTALNISQPNTAAWHLETTQRFVLLASELAREAAPSSIQSISTLALRHLSQADLLAGDDHTKARGKAIMGFVYQNLIGDTTSAIAAYKQALALDPDDKAVQYALVRLIKTDAILKARIGSIPR